MEEEREIGQGRRKEKAEDKKKKGKVQYKFPHFFNPLQQ
jgi:hypothetical protein